MKERIIKIMEHENLIPSKFAEEIGLQHSTISHLLSGRNKPSLNLITKILERFPSINPNWLILGEGSMTSEKQNSQPSLFMEWDKENTSNDNKQLKNKEPEAFEEKEHVPLKDTHLGNRHIAKIMVFYSDNTYETYITENATK